MEELAKPSTLSQDLEVSSREDDCLYMKAYMIPNPTERGLFRRSASGSPSRKMSAWTKLGAAAAVGICLGLVIGAVRIETAPPAVTQVQPRPVASQEPLRAATVTPAPVVARDAASEVALDKIAKAPTLSADEASRLKARNRRLEALISVLRQRRAQEKNVSAEQSSYTGQ